MSKPSTTLGVLAAGALAFGLTACGVDTTPSSDAGTTPAAKSTVDKSRKSGTAKHRVVFKVWGKAPSGVDITYGSDSSNLQGGKLPFKKSIKLHDDAMYYQVTAQLQGGGRIHCSVTVDGKTKKGVAGGGYNICSAQLNHVGLLGGWK
ncbi:MAG TPA: MmpS family transport accessory protein [Streptosporangiales bacterium]